MQDDRRVQTAVLDRPDSERLVFLPVARFDAQQFEHSYRNRSFWCGNALGGCGKRLTIKICYDKVCHFSHIGGHGYTTCYSDSQAIVRFARRRGISDWLSRQRLMPTWREGDYWTDEFGVDFTYRDAPRLLRLEYLPGAGGGWQRRYDRRERADRRVDMIFIAQGRGPIDEAIARFGRVFLLKHDFTGYEPAFEIGTRLGRSKPVWEPLDHCAYSLEHGVVTGTSASRDGLDAPSTAVQPQSCSSLAPAPEVPLSTGTDLMARARAATVRAGLQQAAGRSLQVTWAELDESLGGQVRVGALAAKERAKLLIDVERLAPRSDQPRLSVVLVQSHPADRPLEYLRPALTAVGTQLPSGDLEFQEWCRAEFIRVVRAQASATSATPPLQPPEGMPSADPDAVRAKLQSRLDYVAEELRAGLALATEFDGRVRIPLRMAVELRSGFELDRLGADQVSDLDELIARAIRLRGNQSGGEEPAPSR